MKIGYSLYALQYVYVLKCKSREGAVFKSDLIRGGGLGSPVPCCQVTWVFDIGGRWFVVGGGDSDREGGAGGWCGCGCVAERRRVGVEDGTGLAQWEKDLFSFLLRAACRASAGAPLLLCGHARTRVSGAVTSVLLERPPCGRRCVRARGWLLMSSKAMGGRKAVSHQVKLGVAR